MTPRLIVGVDNYGPEGRTGWPALLDVAQAADEAGIDGVTVVDHVALGGDMSGYPYGAFPGGPDAAWLEPLTTLAAFAGRTKQLRLITGIVIAGLRPPAILAKTVSTLDQLSGGRLELGVGTGWLPKEYEAVGLDFADRGRLLDQSLEVCHRLWSGGGQDFSSPRLTFADVHSSPIPSTPISIWIGGDLHARTIARLVRHGSGWIPAPTARVADIVEAAPGLRAAFADGGRDPHELRIRVSPRVLRDDDKKPMLDATFEKLKPALETIGIADVFVAQAAFGRSGFEPGFFEALRSAFDQALK